MTYVDEKTREERLKNKKEKEERKLRQAQRRRGMDELVVKRW